MDLWWDAYYVHINSFTIDNDGTSGSTVRRFRRLRVKWLKLQTDDDITWTYLYFFSSIVSITVWRVQPLVRCSRPSALHLKGRSQTHFILRTQQHIVHARLAS